MHGCRRNPGWTTWLVSGRTCTLTSGSRLRARLFEGEHDEYRYLDGCAGDQDCYGCSSLCRFESYVTVDSTGNRRGKYTFSGKHYRWERSSVPTFSAELARGSELPFTCDC